MSIDLIILAGGFGTRLKSVSNGIPKALLPISDSVYLDLLVEKVIDQKIANVYLSVYYRPNLFQDYIDKSIFRNKLSIIIEPQPLETGGAVNYVIENSSLSSPFFVINGDCLSDIKLYRMFMEFEKNNFTAMMGISEVEDTYRYGSVVEKDGKVLSFNEKGVRGRGLINNGHYVFNQEVFEGFSGTFSLETELFPKLTKNKKLGAFKVANDNFIDMGVPEDYEKLCNFYKESI